MSEPLRAHFFVTRQNGTMIPLVAMDELPATISIKGVPRMLDSHKIAGMIGIGTFDSRFRKHVVEAPGSLYHSDRDLGENSVTTSAYAITEAEEDPVKQAFSSVMGDDGSVFSSLPAAFGSQKSNSTFPQASGSAASFKPAAELNTQPLKPREINELPINTATGVKEYCSYWLRHGECDYAQQGCLYRHEMPLEKSTLESLGLRDIPRWYREKHRLGSYLAGGSVMGGPVSSSRPSILEKSWRRSPPEVVEATGRGVKNGSVQARTSASTASSSDVRGMIPRSSVPPACGPPGAMRPYHHRFGQPSTMMRYQSSLHSTPVKANLPTVRATPADFETASDRQVRETIKALDAYNEKENKLLSEKFKALVPQTRPAGAAAEEDAGGAGANDEGTPSSSSASVISFGLESAMADDPRLPVKQPAIPTSTTAGPNTPAAAGKRKTRGGKQSKRKQQQQQQPRNQSLATDRKAVPGAEKLVDHE